MGTRRPMRDEDYTEVSVYFRRLVPLREHEESFQWLHSCLSTYSPLIVVMTKLSMQTLSIAQLLTN